jgi:hypothetical protein
MKSRFAIILISALLAVSTFVGLPQFFAQNGRAMDNRISNKLSFEEIREKVTNALPHGTPLAQILTYFKNSNVEHSYYKPDNEVYAAIRNIRGGFLFFVSVDGLIRIRLDESGRLESLDFREVNVGP